MAPAVLPPRPWMASSSGDDPFRGGCPPMSFAGLLRPGAHGDSCKSGKELRACSVYSPGDEVLGSLGFFRVIWSNRAGDPELVVGPLAFLQGLSHCLPHPRSAFAQVAGSSEQAGPSQPLSMVRPFLFRVLVSWNSGKMNNLTHSK